MNFIYTFGILLLIHYYSNVVQCEIFTAMADMKHLVQTEQYLLKSLSTYIGYEELRIQKIKEFMGKVDDVLHINESDIEKYLGNPVNTFSILKRFNNQWNNFDEHLTQHDPENFRETFEKLKPYFPATEDYEGAMTALFRLQDTYKLRSKSLAKGIIPGVSRVAAMETEDVFALGRHAYNLNDWLHSSEWMHAALEDQKNQDDLWKFNVMDYLAFSEFKQGHIKEAFVLTQRMSALKPKEQRILDNLEYYRSLLRSSMEGGKRGDDGLVDDSDLIKRNKISPSGSQTEMNQKREDLIIYEQLCRGEVRQQTKREQSRMKCWYKQKNPVLRIKPQKIERVWTNPEIFILRDIITDTQIEKIKEVAFPLLRRATIQDPITGKLRHADYRVSKSAWLSPHEHKFVTSLYVRSQAATGMDLKAAEQLQIANYGIGGHYEPHFDHAREDEDKFTDLNLGNRIATILFYLSNVDAGGATVFVAGKTAVFPTKNDAVFWFNLKKNGIGNPMTRHAACPVLVGSKWVSNWWIHEYGQEFRRKCSLKPNV